MEMKLRPIARIRTDFPEKFGIPRQSGLVKELLGRIVFEPEFRNPDILRGLEEFSYLWLLWGFECSAGQTFAKAWSPTVRPPRLGGNERKGVFATRSPFRPNPIGLSSVKLERIEQTTKGPQLLVSGIDLRDRTPIYDIKPYLEYTDSHPGAGSGFAQEHLQDRLAVDIPQELLEKIPSGQRNSVLELLAQDPRPSYHQDPMRKYGMTFSGFHIGFRIEEDRVVVTELEQEILVHSAYKNKKKE